MTIFNIDEQNNITAFGSQQEAAATTAIPFDRFSSQQELAELLAGWPAERLVAICNSLPGMTPVKSCKGPKAAASRIWKRIQGLGAQPEQPAKPKAAKKAQAGARSAQGAPARGKAARKATAVKQAPRSKKAATSAKSKKAAGPRAGSKTAQVISMLQRKNGATLAEIMDKMGWQKHTVRGFMAGAMKKAGYQIESFKPAGGERTYRLDQ